MMCLHPERVYNKYLREWVTVPCGKCEACLTSKQLDLTSRVRNEVEQHKYNLFFTLTYDNLHIPYIVPENNFVYSLDCRFDWKTDFHDFVFDEQFCNNINNADWLQYNAVAVLYYPDVQKFLKRVRFHLCEYFKKLGYEKEKVKELSKLRYVVCGEYGSNSNRPHYHGIFHFNSKEACEFVRCNFTSFWPLCDWSSLVADWRKRGCKEKQNPLPTYCGAGAAVSYVSKYIGYYSSNNIFMALGNFKPFLKTSKRPIYGVSAFDKNVYEKTFVSSPEVVEHKIYSSKCGGICSSDILFSKRFLDSVYPKYFGFDTGNLYGTYQVLLGSPLERVINCCKRWRNLVTARFGSFDFTTFCFYVDAMERIVRRMASRLLYEQMRKFDVHDIFGYLSENTCNFLNYGKNKIKSILTKFFLYNTEPNFNIDYLVNIYLYLDRDFKTLASSVSTEKVLLNHRKCLYGKHLSGLNQSFKNTV